MKKVAIVGAGGINSWSAKYLAELIVDYEKKEMMYIKLFDDDQVEEKNLLRSNQNFLTKDLMQNKAKILGDRYNFDWEPIKITEENLHVLQPYDDVILGVDNNKARMLIYTYCVANHKYLLDLRAQATQIMYVVVNKKMEYYTEKYFGNKELNERKGSCQLDRDIRNDHLENGNKIIACLGILGVYFKHLRGETVSTDEYRFVY